MPAEHPSAAAENIRAAQPEQRLTETSADFAELRTSSKLTTHAVVSPGRPCKHWTLQSAKGEPSRHELRLNAGRRYQYPKG